jgi:hypothetical protein
MAFQGFVNEFTNAPIQPTYSSYLQLTSTDLFVPLQWVFVDQNAQYPFSQYIQVVSTAGGTQIVLPNALQASVAQTTTILNSTETVVVVLSNDENTLLLEIDPGEEWVLILTDATTSNGIWLSVQLGSVVSDVTAASLIDNSVDANNNKNNGGLESFSTFIKWNQTVNTITTGSEYTQSTGDRGSVLVWKSGTGTYQCLPSAENGNGYIFTITNNSLVGGQLTILPDFVDTINGVVVPYVLYPGDSSSFVCDGNATIYSFNSTKAQTNVTSLVNINLQNAIEISGTPTITLTIAESQYSIQKYINSYTSSPVTINYPSGIVEEYVVYNASKTTSINVTIPGSANTYLISPLNTQFIISDGTNLYNTPSIYAGDIVLGNGTVLNPALSFENATSTGLFLTPTGANQGNISVDINNSIVTTYTPTQVLFTSVSSTEPSISFLSATETGLYLETTAVNEGNLLIIVDGSTAAEFSPSAALFNDGTNVVPSISFFENDTTGFSLNLLPGINGIVNNAQVTLTTETQFLVPEGSDTVPGYSFVGFDTTGIYCDSTDSYLGFVVFGSTPFYFSANQFLNKNGLVTAPSYAFQNALETGMYVTVTTPGVETNLHLTVDGVDSAVFSDNLITFSQPVSITTGDLILENGSVSVIDGSYYEEAISIYSVMSAYA